MVKLEVCFACIIRFSIAFDFILTPNWHLSPIAKYVVYLASSVMHHSAWELPYMHKLMCSVAKVEDGKKCVIEYFF